MVIHSIQLDGLPSASGPRSRHDTAEQKSLAIVCFSHLRWRFVTQRPQHLLSRAARDRRVFYWEEPIWHDADELPADPQGHPISRIEVTQPIPKLWVIQPRLAHGQDSDAEQRSLLDALLQSYKVDQFVSWYYTPMALSFSSHLSPAVVVYDCMDELSGFLGAPPLLSQREQELLGRAHVVFTGGFSLYEIKREQHRHVLPFPSSIDLPHFEAARSAATPEPLDQNSILHPRVGFYGVVDERFDVDLLSAVSALRPYIQFIVLGPVVKIDAHTLPQAANIHYLGPKQYEELPSYLAGWDAAMMPFAHNDATRFISPTKTPEFLAAGKPVVSTSIRDVVRTYGDTGLVSIADTPQRFAEALDGALCPQSQAWEDAVAASLKETSWDSTWSSMDAEIKKVIASSEGWRSIDGVDTEVADHVTVAYAAHKSSPNLAQARIGSVSRISKPRSRRSDKFDYLVVGAGFAGSVIAERLASNLRKRVLIIDKRDHIAGNAFDYENADGILVHKYGPHIFHTNSQIVVTYLSQFTEWREYQHRVLASVDGKLLPLPINLDTINLRYGLNLDANGMRTFLAAKAVACNEVRTSEQIVLSRVGRELYELFFRNYTRKQWGLDPSELDASVAGRIPVRYDRDDRYFVDSFQAMPLKGYTRMFERMLDHSRITVRVGADFDDVVRSYPEARIIYTGPVDEYFGCRFGPLPYRSLHFKHETHDCPIFQQAAVVNYPNDHSYTRITEFKYLTGQRHRKTSIVYEYPQSEGDPYYPIPRPENAALYEKYRELAQMQNHVLFCGRLANYRYFNMDQVVAQALATVRQIAELENAVQSAHIESRSHAEGLKAISGLAAPFAQER